eukprot:3765424-Pyramimonas_sp.AAC.1
MTSGPGQQKALVQTLPPEQRAGSGWCEDHGRQSLGTLGGDFLHGDVEALQLFVQAAGLDVPVEGRV